MFTIQTHEETKSLNFARGIKKNKESIGAEKKIYKRHTKKVFYKNKYICEVICTYIIVDLK